MWAAPSFPGLGRVGFPRTNPLWAVASSKPAHPFAENAKGWGTPGTLWIRSSPLGKASSRLVKGLWIRKILGCFLVKEQDQFLRRSGHLHVPSTNNLFGVELLAIHFFV